MSSAFFRVINNLILQSSIPRMLLLITTNYKEAKLFLETFQKLLEILSEVQANVDLRIVYNETQIKKSNSNFSDQTLKHKTT